MNKKYLIPSPKGNGYPAHSEKIGTKKKGNNGKLWIVKKRSNGSHYWAPLAKSSVKKSSVKKSSIKNKKRKIYFGEITAHRSMEKSTFEGSNFINVSNKMLKLLSKKPKYINCDYGNSYIFGTRYPLKSYKKILSHYNDVAQTGLIDVTDITEDEKNTIRDSKLWNKVYCPSRQKCKPWDYRPYLITIRKEISPRILFVGETYGGDVGADLYIHFNSKKEIDSLIIENNCLFPNYD